MDIRELIINNLEKKGEVRTSDLVKVTGFSRTYVHRFLRDLIAKGRIISVGKSNNAHYISSIGKAAERAREGTLYAHRILQNRNLSEDIVFDEIKKKGGIFSGLPENIFSILDYAFTEILNNAIEHSKSKTVDVVVKRDAVNVRFAITDKGIGIFNNIMQEKGLGSHLEAIQDLLKGKQTTLPKGHSGEGIFFTSRAADVLIIQSSQKKLIFDNTKEDIFIKNAKNFTGTRVSFTVQCHSGKDLSDIFKRYTDESVEFSKTEVQVKLYRLGVEYVSRSQARRIIVGLDKFKTVILDFSEVETIGQAFADEIFRVWQANHLDIKIVPKNANENVDFMIRRAVSTARG